MAKPTAWPSIGERFAVHGDRLQGMQPSESTPEAIENGGKSQNFRGRTNIVFTVIFVAVLLVCFYFNLRTRLAFVAALFAGFLGAGIWLVLVEDILNPSKRDSGGR